jgi:glycerol-3-phosphate O-acyltransferase
LTKVYSHIIENIEDWPIAKFAKSRQEFVAQLSKFCTERIIEKYDDDLEATLSKTIYQESQRVKLNPWKVDPPEEKAYWAKMSGLLKKNASTEDPNQAYQDMLKRIVNRYSEEIVGDFNPKTFRFARKFLSSFFKRVFNKAFGHGFFNMWGSKKDLSEKIKIYGEIERVRKLFDKGTVVLVPTHYSNIDSILVGYALDLNAGLPAFGYAAGLNLFDVELLAYFMNRLGAYRVDRRKKNPIYLEVLKSYSTLSVINGANNIFFPGGTRSRSGAIESKVKLGLLGSLIDAQNYIERKNYDKKVIVVPMTLGYHFTLEAGNLIDQHLRATGREKYIRSKSQLGKIRSTFRFLRSLYKKDSEVVINIGKPMDVFGNFINDEAQSVSESGEILNTRELFQFKGILSKDFQRETIYTKRLGDKITSQYKKQNIILSSHLVAWMAFKLLEKHYSELELFGILKQPTDDFSVNISDFKNEMKLIIDKLKKMQDLEMLMLSEEIVEGTECCFEHGFKNLGIYHPQRVLYIEDDHIKSDSFKLLYFYHNMLNTYNIELENK